ncbi:hypothetical protein [Cyanobium sp. NS01]|uniref:hypothetical protein n=1 Tax=Cyanobium sp. NS01 TaxID=261284 RepID=UPI001646CF55|nr:hypothetical protein [Cyanobium sp. NS01]MBE9152869.1 hypothetical protein [Cyanobium sp. LEGE 06113]MBE9152926.1 hypothetical protein [Cyanobium sp. LEGE 06113]
MGDGHCDLQPRLLGGWEAAAANVFLCPDAIEREGADPEVVLRHELIHVIQDRVPGPLIPEPLLTVLTRDRVPSGEALLVLVGEEDSQREFECRVLTELLSSEAVADWLERTAEPQLNEVGLQQL